MPWLMLQSITEYAEELCLFGKELLSFEFVTSRWKNCNIKRNPKSPVNVVSDFLSYGMTDAAARGTVHPERSWMSSRAFAVYRTDKY